jgi:hypothetical protein
MKTVKNYSHKNTAQKRLRQGDSALQSQPDIDTSPVVTTQRMRIEAAFGKAMQRQIPEDEEEKLLQGKFSPLQRQPLEEEEEEILQGKFAQRANTSLQKKTAPPPNKTGLPDNLKAGIESHSGIDMSDVCVQHNSYKPAQVNALAHTQGTEIHLGPGQERHLPHEAWHAVQQKQGRVKPTGAISGMPLNDNPSLEREADRKGKEVLQTVTENTNDAIIPFERNSAWKGSTRKSFKPLPIQRTVYDVQPFVIHMPAALSVAANTRLQSVVTTVATMLHNDINIHVQQLIVSVEQEGGADYQGGASTIRGENPAETTTILLPPNPFPAIQITIQRPFAEVATEGELLGMLAHEIGVHNIPSDFRGVNDIATNTWTPIQTPRKIRKGNTPSGGYEFNNWPATAPGQENRQHDHIMVADILRNPPALVGAMPLTRANVHLETVLNIGDTIWADPGKTLREKQKQAKDLVHLYLVDIARIIATDDGRMPPIKHGIAISDIYGEVFTQVLLPRKAAHPWIPDRRPKKNWVSLGLSLWAFIRKVRKEKERAG